MEALISSLNNMEMETSMTPESVTQQKPGPEFGQKPVENYVIPEKGTDKLPGSEVDQEQVETCQDTVVETDTIPDKQADPEDTVVETDAIPDKQADPEDTVVETDAIPDKQADPEDTVVETDIIPDKKADLEAGLEACQKPTETCQKTPAESDVNPEKKTSDPGIIYRCKKCRRMLATQEFVVTHEVGAGGKCFNRGKRSNVDDDEEKPECPCIYVEPMKWMQTVEEGYVSNKLFCMGCKARLGQFNWAGMQCCCGAWVIPAFQLTKSKIDECSM